MNDLKFNGVVAKVTERTQVQGRDGSTYIKYEFKVEDIESKYESSLVFEFFSKEAKEWEKLIKEGNKVSVFFNARTTEWNGKLFNHISAWKVEELKEEAKAEEQPKVQATAPTSVPTTAPYNAQASGNDELPF